MARGKSKSGQTVEAREEVEIVARVLVEVRVEVEVVRTRVDMRL